MLQLYVQVSKAHYVCSQMWHICLCNNTGVCLCDVAMKRIRCVAWLLHLSTPWSCMCTTMHIHPCAFNQRGCLLVAFECSHKCYIAYSFQPIDGIFNAYVQKLFVFLKQISCYWKMYLVIVQHLIDYLLLSPWNNYASNLCVQVDQIGRAHV